MKYFKTAESFFNPRKKKKVKIKNPIDQQLRNEEEAQILDEIALRASQTINNK